MELRIDRWEFHPVQTIGVGYILDGEQWVFEFKTLELPWLNNQRRISCVPAGRYRCVKRKSPRFGHHFHILDVPERDHILIHHGNYYRDTLGCILVGRDLADLDGDGYADVTHSKQTMAMLYEALPEEFDIVITNPTDLTT